jgi:hypothetical protein
LNNEEENIVLHTMLKDDENVEEPEDSVTFISDEELNDEEENVVLHTMLRDDEKVEEPKELMTFSSIEEVCSYYRTYAKQAGFGVIQRSSRKKADKKNMQSLYVLVEPQNELEKVMLRSQLQQLKEQGVVPGFVRLYVMMEHGFLVKLS